VVFQDKAKDPPKDSKYPSERELVRHEKLSYLKPVKKQKKSNLFVFETRAPVRVARVYICNLSHPILQAHSSIEKDRYQSNGKT
jgi:hypothetical protein